MRRAGMARSAKTSLRSRAVVRTLSTWFVRGHRKRWITMTPRTVVARAVGTTHRSFGAALGEWAAAWPATRRGKSGSVTMIRMATPWVNDRTEPYLLG